MTMHPRRLPSLLLALLLLLALGPRGAEAAPVGEDVVGSWEGILDVGSQQILIVLHLEATDDGALAAIFDSPDQAVFGLPAAAERDEEGTLAVRIVNLGAAFDASLEEGALVGTFSQGGGSWPLRLDRRDRHPVVADPERFAGAWQGFIDTGAVKLRTVLHVEFDEAGRATARLDSPDQGAFGIAIDRIDLGEEGSVFFASAAIRASYRGALDEAGRTIEGHFSQGGMQLPLAFGRDAAPAPRGRPQDPKPPFPYRAEEVVVEHEAAGIRLAGTLLLPEGDGPFPAAVLVTGSGPQDRDEALMGHRPFLVLADHLARAGIAVLRCDDRGVGGSTGDFSASTTADVVTDVQAMVAFLRTRAEIRPAGIGVIGHSEGGLIAPFVAAEDPRLAWIVLLAGPGVPGEEILLLQNARLLEVGGAPPQMIERRLEMLEAFFAAMREHDADAEAFAARAKELTAEFADTLDPAEAAAIQGQFASPWMRYFLFLDPRPALARVRCPILALNGSLDLQVDLEQNLGALRETLAAAGHPDYTLTPYEGMNHLFQRATTGAVAEYGAIEETIAPIVLDDLTAWILERASRTP